MNTKERLKELQKKVDSWDNNTFTHFNFQSLSNNPKAFKNYRKDRVKDVDAGKAFLGRNKRRRDRDVIEHPENVVQPKA